MVRPEMESGAQPLQIDVPVEIEDGVYANFLVVHHTEHDFTLDFCQMDPQAAPLALRWSAG
jgi:hypothetical protein